MMNPLTTHARPSRWLSLALYLAAVGLMWLVRFVWAPDQIVPLTYALPLLVCLWHRDPWLLWSMAVSFLLMAGYKTMFLISEGGTGPNAEMALWAMQALNISVVAGTVHAVLKLNEKLRQQNTALESANAELQTQSEELSEQNEEIQSQTEELSQQNEELAQQNEELAQQSEELHAQAEELQTLNRELGQRESILETLLKSAGTREDELVFLQRICRSIRDWFGSEVVAAAVLECQGDQVLVRSHSGESPGEPQRLGAEQTLASIVAETGGTAFIEDLRSRPDLLVPRIDPHEFRSVLAAPLRVGGTCVGSLELYSSTPQRWSRRHFQVLEWLAARAALTLEAWQLRQELAHSNERLEQQVRERTAKLAEMVEELEHFSYSITHDMRAPLRAMHGFASLLRRDCGPHLDQANNEYLRRIITAAERMDRLIVDSLSYSKALRQEPALTAVDPHKLLDGMIQSYPMFQPPQARIELVAPLPTVLANEAALTQCFSNLLHNAVKFVRPGDTPKVRIRATCQNDLVRFWFEDQGIGIPPEMEGRLFGMFQRANKTYEGTGIGLALVRKVVERMGGRVGVESEPDKGSRFWVELRSAQQWGGQSR